MGFQISKRKNNNNTYKILSFQISKPKNNNNTYKILSSHGFPNIQAEKQ